MPLAFFTDNADLGLQLHTEFLFHRRLYVTDQAHVVLCRRLIDVHDKASMLLRHLGTSDANALQLGVLNQLAREIPRRALEYTAAGRVFKRLLGFPLRGEVIHLRLDLRWVCRSQFEGDLQHGVALRADDAEVRAFADQMYEKLQDAGIEVIFDDRPVSAGVMFSDADLTGVPLRVVVSPKGLKNGTVEVAKRDKSMMEKVDKDQAFDFILDTVKAMKAECENINI